MRRLLLHVKAEFSICIFHKNEQRVRLRFERDPREPRTLPTNKAGHGDRDPFSATN